MDRIAQLFDDKIIFLTGGTGFMGKVFIERLLRDTKVRKIFLLIREKKSKKIDERLDAVLADPLFGKLKESKTVEEIRSKLQPINGDCSELNLSMDALDRLVITQNVDYIFHFAATVKFTEKFSRAIIMNVRGTREMLKIAADCEKLSLYCHLSTAFCHLDEKVLLEKFYESPADAHEMIDVAESFAVDEVERRLSAFLGRDIPNSYIFSKALAEALIVSENERLKLPVVVCRPAVVTSSYRDPIAGWTDNLNGPCSLVIAAGTGILRVVYRGSKEENLGYSSIPVDFAINQMMMSCWDFMQNEKPSIEPHFVNFQVLKENIFQLSVKYFATATNMLPLNQLLWYPKVKSTNNYFLFCLMSIVYHWIPAVLIDFAVFLCGRKPFLLQIHSRISKELKCLAPFLKNEWTFDDTKIKEILLKLNELELKKYGSFNIDGEFYIFNLFFGVRKFLMKQDESSIAGAKKSLKRFYLLDKLLQLMFVAAFLYFIKYKFL